MPSKAERRALNTGLAATLAESRSIPAARDALRGILETRLPQISRATLDEAQLEAVLDALSTPVATAMADRADAAREYARRATHQAIANRLGLGQLAKDEDEDNEEPIYEGPTA